MKANLTLYFLLFFTTMAHAQQTSVQCEDTCQHVHGIDLSHYQGRVFWEHVGENAHNAYVYLKATEGGDRIDPTFKKNIELAHKNGLRVGSYHFYRPITDQQAQLCNFRTQCVPALQDLLPMIDVETTNGLTTEQFCDSLFKFLKLVEKEYRQKPLIYTGANFYDKHLQGKLDGYHLMVAQYTDYEPRLKDDRDITLWQYTAKGRIRGVNGFIDKSRLMGQHQIREIRFRHYIDNPKTQVELYEEEADDEETSDIDTQEILL